MTHGGSRDGAGRKAGQPNKISRELGEIAREYSERAISVLAQVMESGESEQARIAAANALLDRGYGKPKQSMDIDATVAVRDLTPEQRAARILELEARRRDRNGGG